MFVYKSMVPKKGLEPPHLSAPEPKSGASTNFATWASGAHSIILWLKIITKIGIKSRLPAAPLQYRP